MMFVETKPAGARLSTPIVRKRLLAHNAGNTATYVNKVITENIFSTYLENML